jgi:hypothetical protein
MKKKKAPCVVRVPSDGYMTTEISSLVRKKPKGK